MKEIKKIPNLETPESKDKGKFKRSGHLADQMLKYSYPKEEAKQLSIWDALSETVKKDIEIHEIERSEVVEGIKLTPSETKLVDSFCKILQKISQTKNSKNKDYYTGNLEPEIIEYGGERTPAPKLAFTLYELTKEYKGEETIGGKDVENVKRILEDLSNKRFLIRYTETSKGKNGEWIKKEIDTYRKILDVDQATLSYGKGNIEHYKKTETIIILNPIFRRQINSKFILYPNDINKRTAIAYGSHNVSDITLRLRDYLIRELSSKRYTPQIYLDKLHYQLAEKWMRESRKAKVKKDTERAFEVMINLGLLQSYETVIPNNTGEPKIIFTLNKNWE